MSNRRKLGELQSLITLTLSKHGALTARQLHEITSLKIEIIYVRLRQMELEDKVERCEPRTTVRGHVVSSWRIKQNQQEEAQNA